MGALLHDVNLKLVPLAGRLIKYQLIRRASEMIAKTEGMTDPDVSIVIRSRNDIAYAERWFKDIQAQEFSGKTEVIVVDTESTDGTAEYARSQGAIVLSISQADFTYPKSLNLGFRVAKYPYVVTTVGHAYWTNRYLLRSLTYWSRLKNFGGIYNLTLPSQQASIWERLVAMSWPLLTHKARVRRKLANGILGANCSVLRRDAWKQLGGYDERYAGGGEDVALARRMLTAGLVIVQEPLFIMYHAHGLGLIDSVKQLLHWIEVGKQRPQPFDVEEINARRPDLRAKS